MTIATKEPEFYRFRGPGSTPAGCKILPYFNGLPGTSSNTDGDDNLANTGAFRHYPESYASGS